MDRINYSLMKKMRNYKFILLSSVILFGYGNKIKAQALYNLPQQKTQTTWTSFENPGGVKGVPGKPGS